MDNLYEFSMGWLFVGIIIMAFGGCIAAFYKPIADNLASGINSYQNVKKFGIITIAVGFVVAVSLHTLFLNIFVNLFFNR